MKTFFSRIALLLLSASILLHDAHAAPTSNAPIFPTAVNRGIVQFLQGTDSAGTYKTIYTAGSNGSIIKALWATTNDASLAHLVTCQIVNTAVSYGGTAVSIPISSGFASGAPPVNMMSFVNWPGLPLDSDGNPFLYLVSGDTLKCTFATGLTSSDVINLVAVASDF